MEYESHIRDVFPEVGELNDQDLRDGVLIAWTRAMQENGVNDLYAVPWFPPLQEELDLHDEYLVPHVREVTQCAMEIARIIARDQETILNIDLLIAGGLIHDISKLYEYHGETETKLGNLFGHPYTGVYVTITSDLPVELGHIVLSHTDLTNVEPALLEAEIVKRADEVSFAAIQARSTNDLRNV